MILNECSLLLTNATTLNHSFIHSIRNTVSSCYLLHSLVVDPIFDKKSSEHHYVYSD